MPANWPAAECWEPDKVFAQIQAGLLNAKSIGWLPTKAHFTDVKETASAVSTLNFRVTVFATSSVFCTLASGATRRLSVDTALGATGTKKR